MTNLESLTREVYARTGLTGDELTEATLEVAAMLANAADNREAEQHFLDRAAEIEQRRNG